MIRKTVVSVVLMPGSSFEVQVPLMNCMCMDIFSGLHIGYACYLHFDWQMGRNSQSSNRQTNWLSQGLLYKHSYDGVNNYQSRAKPRAALQTAL